MALSASLGPLLQGVSQQPQRARLPGQVSAQINLYSAVDTGLTSRTGTDQIGMLANADSDMSFFQLQLSGVDYLLGFKTAELRAWKVSDGTELTVNYQDTDARDYVGPDMRFHVVDDDVFCNNREVEVAESGVVGGYPFHAGIVSALGGNYDKTYTVNITYADDTVSTITYTTPTGTTSGDAAKSTSEYIITQLYNDLVADTVFIARSSATAAKSADTLLIKDTESLTITVEDGEAGAILRAITDTADDVTHLPRFAPEGAVVRVLGDTADEDDYYLAFNVISTDTVGSGFGEQGTWEESADPTIDNSFDMTTMPHVMTFNASTSTFTLARGSWEDRRTGNADSNPFASFVGAKIRDIGGFESRLVFSTSAGTVVMSRTKKPYDFWRKSATTLVDADVIDMKSTREKSLSLDWLVPFDRDLVVISDPGDAQFVITAGGITPSNASMVLTTSYETAGGTPPVTTGRTVVFPFLAGSYAGVKEFFTSQAAAATNTAETLTEVQKRYIPGKIVDMASAKNFNTILFRTDHDDYQGTVWVYKYLWEGINRLQSSWSKWQFADNIRFMGFINSSVVFIVEDTAGHWLLRGDMNKPVTGDFSYHLTLDRKTTVTVSSSTVTVPFDNARFAQSTGCLDEGREIQYISKEASGTDWVYTLDEAIAPDSAEVIAGLSITTSLTPTMPLIKDKNGVTVSDVKLIVSDFFIHLAESGEVAAIMTCAYREPYTFYPRRFPLDDEVLDPDGQLLSDDVLHVPWKEDAALSTLTIESTNIRPTTIQEVSWWGTASGNKRRI